MSGEPTVGKASRGPGAGGDPLEAIVDRLRAEGGRYFGDEHARLEPLSRQERVFSSVVRCRVSAAGDTFDIFVKRWKPRLPGPEHLALVRRRLQTDYDTMVLVDRALRGNEEFATVTPIAVFPDDLAIATRQVEGQTLGELLRAHGRWRPSAPALHQLAAVFGRAGRWLRVFHTLQRPEGRFPLDDLREYIDVRLQRLVAAPVTGFTERDRDAVLAWFDAQCPQVSSADGDLVLVHADYSPGNLLFDGTRLTVIDFPMTRPGHRLHDLTHLHTQLDFMRAKPHYVRSTVERVQQALLSGFGEADARDPMFRILELKHVVCHYCGLVSRPAASLSRLYNRLQMGRHRRWLRAL